MIDWPAILLPGISAVLAVAAIGVSLFAAWRTQAMVLAADRRAREGMEECAAAQQALRKMVDALAIQLRESRPAEPAIPPAGMKPGFNLTKRSQVLRMHRNGDPPDRISAALAVPLQEVDLLIKVHRIVIKSI